jgi:hypothetical protein
MERRRARQTLRSLFFHGCRLATAAQEQHLLRILQLLIPPENVPGYTLWADMAGYPMASIIYAGGMGALAEENWRLLRGMLTFRWRANGRERIACDRLSACRALDNNVANALFQPQKRRTPVSDHLAGLLAPLAAYLYPDPRLLFDELEAWVGLAYLDVVRDLNSRPLWMPPGCFCWRAGYGTGGPLSTTAADALAAGAEWPPLAAGWFNGHQDRWDTIQKAFNEIYGQLASGFW